MLDTRALLSGLEAARTPMYPAHFDARELAGLPRPVQRYLRTALTDGQPLVAAAGITQAGALNMGRQRDRWMPFTSTQRVVTRRPGFVWKARVAVMPGLAIQVHDALVAGEGILHAALFGLLPLANVRGTPEMAAGELLRFFIEAVWYPTALLPSQGVRWDAIDDTSATASLSDNGTVVTLRFQFDEHGLAASRNAESHVRIVGGAVVPTPWEGHVWNYDLRDGMRVPVDGEVAWMLPEGRKPYWRARVTGLTFEFAD